MFIKTKDGTIHKAFVDEKQRYWIALNPSERGMTIFDDICYHENEIIDKADDINSLIDERVLVKYWTKPGLIEDFEAFAFYDPDKNELYGSIWVNENLRKVAKAKAVWPDGKIDWELL